MRRGPGRFFLGWALGVLTTLAVVAWSGGWYEYRWYAPSDCAQFKAAAVNRSSFEVVPGQSDACYLRRPRIRPWQWPDWIAETFGGR